MRLWADLRHLPRTIWLLSGATLVNRVGTMVLPFLTLYLTQSLGRYGKLVSLVAPALEQAFIHLPRFCERLLDLFALVYL